MNIKEVYGILIDKLNKLSTNYSQEVNVDSAMRALNQAQYYWLDERLKKEELTKIIQKETQHLIKTLKVTGDTQLPVDFYHFSNARIKGKIEGCKVDVQVHLIENSNLGEWLSNENTKPDFKWEQALVTIKDNKFVFYTGEGIIESCEIDYYKRPNKVDMQTPHTHVDGTPMINIDLEFEDSSAYEIIDLAALIISGNISDSARTNFQSTLVSTFK